MADQSPLPVDFVSILAQPENGERVFELMVNPWRDINTLMLNQLETITTAMMAGGGNPQDTLYAIMIGGLQHINDPLIVLQKVMAGAQQQALNNHNK